MHDPRSLARLGQTQPSHRLPVASACPYDFSLLQRAFPWASPLGSKPRELSSDPAQPSLLRASSVGYSLPLIQRFFRGKSPSSLDLVLKYPKRRKTKGNVQIHQEGSNLLLLIGPVT